MFIGHYGVSLAVKAKAPSLSLGWLFLAVQALDVLFCAFVLTGAEHLRIVPGFTAYNPYDLYHMPISHSLLGSAGWSVGTVLAARLLRLPWAPAVALGVAVFSHFVLDFPMHVQDLPLAGAESPKLGLGLWNHRGWSLAFELACLGAGALVYARHRRALGARYWVFIGVLSIVTLATPFLPPPPSAAAFAVQALAAYVALAALAGWVDRR